VRGAKELALARANLFRACRALCRKAIATVAAGNYRPGYGLHGFVLRAHSHAAMRYVGSLSGRRPCDEDRNVRTASQGIVDVRGVGPSIGYRSRYVVELPNNPRA